MTPRDMQTLQQWLKSGCSLNDVRNAESMGMVDNVRFSEAPRRAFILLWHWSALRMSSNHQERVYNKCGREFVHRRIARAHRIIERLTA